MSSKPYDQSAMSGDCTLAIIDRKERDRAQRRQRITAAARTIAEREGWNAVTIRRLADEIEYSQPVLYSHFDGRDAIVAAVALDGFQALALAIGQAAHTSPDAQAALHVASVAYLAFARENPAVYEAMFTMINGLRFAGADRGAELKGAFAALAGVVMMSRTDVQLATETYWAALHGLAELERSGRIRQSARDERLTLLVRAFVA